jgi:OOP family OmpA-OmpF porin
MGRNKLSLAIFLAIAVGMVSASGCATRKYVRQHIDERVSPVEKRTDELEETSRRNSSDITRLGSEVSDARTRADRAQQAADTAQSSANQAGAKADQANQRVAEVEGKILNLDAYSLQRTVTVTFKTGSAVLDPEAMAALDALAGQVTGKKGYVLEIQGFTDSRGGTTLNQSLSDRRAHAVYEYLAQKHDIPLFRMNLLGYGEDRAVADNKSREGRAQNRRVEVRVLTSELSDVPKSS